MEHLGIHIEPSADLKQCIIQKQQNEFENMLTDSIVKDCLVMAENVGSRSSGSYVGTYPVGDACQRRSPIFDFRTNEQLNSTLRLLITIFNCRLWDKIISDEKEIVIKYFEHKLSQLNMTDTLIQNDISDFEYIIRLGLQRNYRDQCPICLTENFRGTECSCGHTEIIVFRPCGHSMCGEPCLEQFANSNGLVFGRAHVDDYYIGEYKKLNIEGFSCPYCRQNVEKLIRTSQIQLPNEWFNEIKVLVDDYVRIL
jgi:hypothetical protein